MCYFARYFTFVTQPSSIKLLQNPPHPQVASFVFDTCRNKNGDIVVNKQVNHNVRLFIDHSSSYLSLSDCT